jgi:predicted dehydrogenase
LAFNLAIIGFGGMAGWHWENIIREMPGITIVGGYDVREKAFADMRDKGLKTYQTPEELYADQSIDVVLIATPNNFHKPYSIACLEAGKHVICEKPVTLNAMELEEILAVSKKTGKFFTAHQNRRWDTDYLSMRGVYESGILARP